ncbi:hypothetical protein IW01_09540, partial [Pectobacterium brasiliense]
MLALPVQPFIKIQTRHTEHFGYSDEGYSSVTTMAYAIERLSDVAYSLAHKNETGIIVCSALKKRYRDRLREGNEKMVFIYLKGSF